MLQHAAIADAYIQGWDIDLIAAVAALPREEIDDILKDVSI